MTHIDDFDTQIQPEELHEEPMLMPEDIQDDNPIDDYFVTDEQDWDAQLIQQYWDHLE